MLYSNVAKNRRIVEKQTQSGGSCKTTIPHIEELADPPLLITKVATMTLPKDCHFILSPHIQRNRHELSLMTW
jgi:hypothetical protein